MSRTSRPRHLFGVPLHPLLVHFPIVFWLILPPLDVAILVFGTEPWLWLGIFSAAAGVGIGAVAILAGLLEYRDPSLAGIDMRLAAKHGTRTSLAWCVFATRLGVALLFLDSGLSIVVCLGLDLLGSVMLVQGIIFGTRQVYAQLEK